MTGSQGTSRRVARRTIVSAVGAAGLATALVACGSDDADTKKSGTGDTSAETGGGTDGGTTGGTGDSGGTGGTGDSGDTGGTGGSGGKELAKVADIPEGGGTIVDGLVITQPSAGTFKAFSAKCTHQGCAVKSVENNLINCPCHNSNFDATDGSVKSGPATAPLPEQAITVEAGAIRLG
ncbi:Rieske (2Fe-2S) protein [Streptomyces sp. NPDC000594]|uniref:Rieske (2Fe-2S) protein n=1 Tax=Streptomyces sp. NPDC000594 TaxID=3154261 RepID=UPI00332E1D0B